MEAHFVKHSAPGKTILFGEHAVVYGYPAIATAIGLRASCKVRESSDGNTYLSASLFPNESFKISEEKLVPSELEAFKYIILKLSEHTKSNIASYVELSSNIPSSAGLGSSAATAVSLTKSLLVFYRQDYNLDRVNEISFEAEKITHGTPSGIDNSISTYGGGIIYENGSISKLSSKLPTSTLLIIDSGVQRQTKKIVERIREKKKNNPQIVDSIFSKITAITYDAKKHIESGNIKEVGHLMNENNELLERLGLSIPAFTEIIKILDKSEVIGRKITGAGGGGCLVALYKDYDEAQEVARSLTLKGYDTYLSNIFEMGVRDEQ